MNKYKVCVYAICKNEEQFVDRWYESMKEADAIYVLDTGSTDNTVDKLRERGINVKVQEIKPWRFDIARNLSLDMVPEDCDICVCTDLDEVLNEGWRSELERVWNKDTTRCRYIYNWKLDENDKPIVSFYYEKFHARNGFKWIYPVHEVLSYDGNESYVITDKIILNHYPDESKSRGSYLGLLELSVKEYPESDRNRHYLGREYMFHSRWNEAIDTLLSHLKMENATWKDERAASMRFIARCYKNLNRLEEARMWFRKAIIEAPYLRDAYVELAMLEYNEKNYLEVDKYCKEAIKIKINERSYINEPFTFDETTYDLLSISNYYLGKYEDSLYYINEALKINPNNERIINNKKLISDIVNKNNNLNYIDRAFYNLTTHLSSLTEEEIFNNIKNKYLTIPNNIKIALEDFFKKFNNWGSLDYKNNNYEEIINRAKSIYNHLDDFIWLYKNLNDYRSKKLLYAILNNWYNYDFNSLKECYENQYKDYFDLDVVECNNNEVLVDLGAYNGDSILDYLGLYGNNYKKIYAYEITDSTFKELTNNLSKYNNIILRNKAVSNENTTMYIKENESKDANSISNDGNNLIEVVTLDSDIKDDITMIKMDIEGYEYKALEGAREHIIKNKPKLLISVYHNHYDIYRIPKLINEYNSNYKFYLRYHGNNLFPTEVTLIAIYEE